MIGEDKFAAEMLAEVRTAESGTQLKPQSLPLVCLVEAIHL